MSSTSTFEWPNDNAEAAKAARELFLNECSNNARYWIKWIMDFVMYPDPEKPFERPSSDIAKEDAAFRKSLSSLSTQQKENLLELLNRSLSGVIFSTLLTFDQFPHGEASIHVREGLEKEAGRQFLVSPTDTELHEDFYKYHKDVTPEDIQRKPNN